MSDPSATAARLARDLLQIGAVRLSPETPFTWASGLRSPVYCDNRLTIGHPDVRRRITSGFAEIIHATGIRPEFIAGTATAGIPHAAWLADRLELPMVYVRGKAKGHGTSSRIEGPVVPGGRVVLVEDLVSTGGSSVSALEALREAGFVVEDVLAIYTYGFPRAEEAFAAAEARLHVLTSLESLIDEARAQQFLDQDAIASLEAWRRDPEGWSAAKSQS